MKQAKLYLFGLFITLANFCTSRAATLAAGAINRVALFKHKTQPIQVALLGEVHAGQSSVTYYHQRELIRNKLSQIDATDAGAHLILEMPTADTDDDHPRPLTLLADLLQGGQRFATITHANGEYRTNAIAFLGKVLDMRDAIEEGKTLIDNGAAVWKNQPTLKTVKDACNSILALDFCDTQRMQPHREEIKKAMAQLESTLKLKDSDFLGLAMEQLFDKANDPCITVLIAVLGDLGLIYELEKAITAKRPHIIVVAGTSHEFILEQHLKADPNFQHIESYGIDNIHQSNTLTLDQLSKVFTNQ